MNDKSECCGNCAFWEHQIVTAGFCHKDPGWAIDTESDFWCEHHKPVEGKEGG